MEGFYIAALQMVPGMGIAAVSALLKFLSSPRSAWEATGDELAAMPELTTQQRENLLAFRGQNRSLPEKLAEECKKKQISVCTQADNIYPEILKEISRPPLVLFYRGRLQPDELRLAMVGSRKATPYGKNVAEALAREIAAQGITVVSGAAYGIDTASHKGALATGKTIAVLGCGVDIAYPASNRRLLDEIAENGAVVSEYAPGTRPIAAFFPARNRIISGLSRGTVVVEAAERSGSLITAEMALSEGRDVFAVPGSIFSEQSRGTNRLIQQGAKLVQSADDVLNEYITVTRSTAENVAADLKLTDEETAVYRLLSAEQPVSIDDIICRLNGSNVSNVAFLLLQMELKGLVEEDCDHNYLKVVKEGQL